MSIATLKLKKHEERRLKGGHLWIYSNEVNVKETPLSAYTPGETVEFLDYKDRPLGSGYVNPHSLICARLLSRDPRRPIDLALIRERLQRALALRERLFEGPYYRLAYAEADGLPGLVVDRFGDVVVVQITTAGMEVRREEICTALQELLAPRAIVLRNDAAIRELEGLTRYTETALGDAPEQLTVEENGCRFHIAPLSGQKTGWYYDHRDNRRRMARYVRDRRVLDVFSYCGAWGIQAAVQGGAAVTCIDNSEAALAQLGENAALNGVADRIERRHGDAFEQLRQLREAHRRFDVVIVDPPAFIKRKKDHEAGLLAYRRINEAALRVLEEGGILISASCSFHLDADALQRAMVQAARPRELELRILEQGHQAADHPVHPVIPETNYLKTFFAEVERAR